MLCLGQKVANLQDLKLNVTQRDIVVTTDKGTELKADLVICCAGNKINSGAYSATMSMCLCVCICVGVCACLCMFVFLGGICLFKNINTVGPPPIGGHC